MSIFVNLRNGSFYDGLHRVDYKNVLGKFGDHDVLELADHSNSRFLTALPTSRVHL